MSKEQGQAMLETLVALPLAILLVAAVAQMLWLLLAQQMLQSASIHVVRQGSLDGMNQVRMLQVLEKRMRPLPGKALHLPHIERLHPDDNMIRKHAKRVREGRDLVYELSSDFSSVRLHELDNDEAREAWLRARILQIEVTWCQPLLIPIVATVVAAVIQRSANPAQQYCNVQSVARRPMIAIQTQATAQLIAPLRLSTNRVY
ncbi:TadE family protein [Aliidiomarina sp. Khilg15.8]